MDWWKLFALLVTTASLVHTAEGAKKKIRIHLPQKVKHIHHHKKIYITNHPASSQYAPAYLPAGGAGGAGAAATPTRLAVPALLPRPAPSKLLPLYRARGYYGPTPSEYEEQEIDLVPPPDAAGYAPSAFAEEPRAPPPPPPPPAPRIKIIKLKDGGRKKKVLRKRKPKRVIKESPSAEEDAPVSPFHEHFYSDLDTQGTIRKIRKPKRVEKIVDGDTEHIHTYSEEHIHKVVFPGRGAGPDAAGSVAALKYGRLPALGSLGTPLHMEYAGYNPRDVTHDHVFHDHGEIPPNVDLAKNSLGYPPQVSYTSAGVKIPNRPTKGKPRPSDFSYYENMYSPSGVGRPRKPHRPTKYYNEASVESDLEPYRPLPAFKFNKKKPYGQASSASYAGASGAVAGVSNFRDPFTSYSSVYPSADTYAAPSNVFATADAAEDWPPPPPPKHKKKSVSSQNMSFGGQDHKTIVDHLAEFARPFSKDGQAQNALFEDFESKPAEATPAPQFTITEQSPAHGYYTSMALQAFQEDPQPLPEASSDHFQFAAAPGDGGEEPAPTTAAAPHRQPAPSRRRRPRPRPEEPRPAAAQPEPARAPRRRPAPATPRATASTKYGDKI